MLSSDTDAWIRAISRTFARRVVQEAAMDVRYIPVVLMEDEPVHTDERPWCRDVTCPCHSDDEGVEARERLLWEPYYNGLLTWEEVIQTFYGKQL